MTPTKKEKGCYQILPPDISETFFNGIVQTPINHPVFKIIMTCLLFPEQVCI